MICAKNPGRWLEVRNLKKPNLDKVTTFAGCLRFFEWVFSLASSSFLPICLYPRKFKIITPKIMSKDREQYYHI